MKYTLLETVQLILSAMDSDEVQSITDTTEAYQVALMAKSVFEDLCVDLNLPSQHRIFQLTPSGDSSKPVLMTVPTSPIRKIEWVKYDNVDTVLGETRANYVDCTYLPFEDFIVRQTGFRNDTSSVGEMTFTSNGQDFKMMYQTNAFPLYYTCFDDNTFIFDSYRSDIDTTLQQSKTLASGYIYQTFTLSDSFTPPLEPDQFSLFHNKLKTRAFAELKQQDNKEAATEARRQKVVSQKRKRLTPDLPEVFKVARYGRNSAYGSPYADSILEKYGRNGT